MKSTPEAQKLTPQFNWQALDWLLHLRSPAIKLLHFG
jgi:hypothetical protein